MCQVQSQFTISFVSFLRSKVVDEVLEILDRISTSQVERYGPYTAVYGHFNDRIKGGLRENTVRLRRRIKQIYGENTDSRID
jgi:hypothetical protein